MPKALAATERVCASVNVGSTKTGINMTAVRDMGETIKIMSKGDKWLNAKLVVFANAVEDNPFMAGAFHGVGEADTIINVGVSGPGVVKRALEKSAENLFDILAETIKRQLLKLQELVNLLVKWLQKDLMLNLE